MKFHKIFFLIFILSISLPTSFLTFISPTNLVGLSKVSDNRQTVICKTDPSSPPIDLQSFNFGGLFTNSCLKTPLTVPNSTDLILKFETDYYNLIKDQVELLGGNIKFTYHFDNTIAIFVPNENITKLCNIIGIEKVWEDRLFEACMNESVPIIKGQWSSIETYFGKEINGCNIKVAILDTGIDAEHWDLYPRVILNQSYVSGEGWQDENGHGTHVSGIIGGNGNRSSSKFTGVAPCVNFLNFKVLNRFAVGYESAIISALEDAVGNDSDVINLSLATRESGYGDDPYSMKLKWVVEEMGIPCIVAAGGNNGYYNISCPGVCPSVITVGASDKSDQIYANSPYGPTLSPIFAIKPDIIAPGKSIISVSSAYGGPYGQTVGPYYHILSGTSMSAAHVTGAVALLLQVHPDWSPSDIKDALSISSSDLGLNLFVQGSGRIFVPSAINSSVLVNNSLSFGLLPTNHIKNMSLIVRNIGNLTYNLSLAHSNNDYSVPINVVILPFSSNTFEVSLSPGAFNGHHNVDVLNISGNYSQQIRIPMSSINPTVEIDYPIRYSAYNISGKLQIDDVISYNHSGYFAKLYINDSYFDGQFLNASGHFSFNSYPFLKGFYNVSFDFYDDNNFFLFRKSEIIYCQGLISSFNANIGPLMTGSFTFMSFKFNSNDVSGVIIPYIFSFSRNITYLPCIVSGGSGSSFLFLGWLAPGVYPVDFLYSGDAKYDSLIVSSSVMVFPSVENKFILPDWVWWLIIASTGIGSFFGIFIFFSKRSSKELGRYRSKIYGESISKARIKSIQNFINEVKSAESTMIVKIQSSRHLLNYHSELERFIKFQEGYPLDDIYINELRLDAINSYKNKLNKIEILSALAIILPKHLTLSNALAHIKAIYKLNKFDNIYAFNNRIIDLLEFNSLSDSTEYLEILVNTYNKLGYVSNVIISKLLNVYRDAATILNLTAENCLKYVVHNYNNSNFEKVINFDRRVKNILDFGLLPIKDEINYLERVALSYQKLGLKTPINYANKLSKLYRKVGNHKKIRF